MRGRESEDDSEQDESFEDETADEDEHERPVMFAMLSDPRYSGAKGSPDAIWNLVEEVFDPNPLRSHVITLHLYVEYWLNKLLQAMKTKNIEDMTFFKKIEKLQKAGALDGDTHSNLLTINRLRNIYAHELDLPKAENDVRVLLKQLRIDLYFTSTDKDPLRSVCFQTMMMLETTLNNGLKPPKHAPFPREAVRAKLLKTGELFWQECEIVGKEEHGYLTKYLLRCPLCGTGTIEREKDDTPGFKESTIWPCDNCGLDGESTILHLKTAKAEFRPDSTSN